MMGEAVSTRLIGDLTFPEVSRQLGPDSILCLPVGAIEQHGPHLPLSTDLIIAEEIAHRLIAKWAGTFDLWRLPSVPIGLSREHDWAPGTLSLSVQSFTALMRDLAGSIQQNLPTRNLVVINGHGGNRGVLQTLLYELEGDFSLNACIVHPLALAKVDASSTIPEIHGGRDETSLMLALAPHLVRTDMIGSLAAPPDAEAIRELVIEQGASWAWSSADPRIADQGITGAPQGASAEFGNVIIERILQEARRVLDRLVDRSHARGTSSG